MDKGIRILVAEEDSNFLKMMEDSLKASGSLYGGFYSSFHPLLCEDERDFDMAGRGFCSGIDWHHDDAIHRDDRRPKLSDSIDINPLKRWVWVHQEDLDDPLIQSFRRFQKVSFSKT